MTPKLGLWATNQSFPANVLLITVKQNHAVCPEYMSMSEWMFQLIREKGNSWAYSASQKLTQKQNPSLWESNNKDLGIKCYRV